MEEVLNNKTFWNERYLKNPELGSGIGSRGEILEYKKNIIKPILNFYSNNPILDIGFGDLELMKDFDLANYTGFDLSDVAVEKAKKLKPNWKFFHEDLSAFKDRSFDLVTCFDVLIHQPSRQDYDNLIETAVRCSNDSILIAGFDYAPEIASEITFYYEPLSETLKKREEIVDFQSIGSYRDVTLFLAQKRTPDSSNKNDIGIVNLYYGLSNSETPNLLIDLVKKSREKISFYPKTTIRMFEYPWVIHEVDRIMGEENKNRQVQLADIGAGVSILPLYLADQGYQVTTIDSHNDLDRKIDEMFKWNEWGFLDYSKLNPNITSLREDASTYTPENKIDIAFSVSVIEHIPSKLRRELITNVSKWLDTGGYFLITMDLIPGTNKLWNLSEGKKVESGFTHGRVNSVIKELKSCGFEIEENNLHRKIKDSRTDVVYLVCRKIK